MSRSHRRQFDACEKGVKGYVYRASAAAGVHLKTQERLILPEILLGERLPITTPSSELMVSHGGYDNSDVNKDINCMFPIDRIHELAAEGVTRACAPVHAGFMGGGGIRKDFKHETGPAIAQMFKEEDVDAGYF